MTTPDRRRSPRTKANWPLTVQPFSGEAVAGEVMNVSLTGMKITAGPRVRVGAAVTLRVTLPRESEPLEIPARVVRRDLDGIAVDFIDLAEAAAARLRLHVSPWEVRRRSPRVSLSLPVTVRGQFEPRPQRGSIIDLSAFAARIMTAGRLQDGERVALDLPLLDGDAPMRIPAVVWEIGDRGAVLVFHDVPPADFQRLSAYVQRTLGGGP
jgi:hypothetical protein